MLNYDEQQEKLKTEAYEKHKYANQGNCATSNMCCGDSTSIPMRSSMRDRLFRQLSEAEDRAHRAGQLRELIALLDKNPDVARILDLMELS